MDLPKIRYFLQEQQTFRRAVHNRENYQKNVKCPLEGILWGVWRYSGVFEVRHPGTRGDNRRTGVKMDSIEQARRIPS